MSSSSDSSSINIIIQVSGDPTLSPLLRPLINTVASSVVVKSLQPGSKGTGTSSDLCNDDDNSSDIDTAMGVDTSYNETDIYVDTTSIDNSSSNSSCVCNIDIEMSSGSKEALHQSSNNNIISSNSVSSIGNSHMSIEECRRQYEMTCLKVLNSIVK